MASNYFIQSIYKYVMFWINTEKTTRFLKVESYTAHRSLRLIFYDLIVSKSIIININFVFMLFFFSFFKQIASHYLTIPWTINLCSCLAAFYYLCFAWPEIRSKSILFSQLLCLLVSYFTLQQNKKPIVYFALWMVIIFYWYLLFLLALPLIFCVNFVCYNFDCELQQSKHVYNTLILNIFFFLIGNSFE